jgi:hypothetical protein
MAFLFNNPLNFQLRAGTISDPYIDKFDSRVIINNQITLDEIPDQFTHVTISGYTEVFRLQDLTSSNFYTNYVNGCITFMPSEETKTVTASYKGRGIIQYPAERIVDFDGNGNVVGTLQDVIDNGKLAISAINGITPTIATANVLNTTLLSDISTGNTLNTTLLATTSSANTSNATLVATNSTANSTNSTLTTTNQTASNTNTALNASNTNAINTKTALDSSNTTATNTNTTLLASNSTANTTKTSLDASISTGNTLKTNLDTSTSTANTTKISLDSSVSSANSIKSTLDSVVAGIQGSSPFNQTFIATASQQDFVLTLGLYKDYPTTRVLIQGVEITPITDYVFVVDGNSNKIHINEALPISTEVNFFILGTLPTTEGNIIL